MIVREFGCDRGRGEEERREGEEDEEDEEDEDFFQNRTQEDFILNISV